MTLSIFTVVSKLYKVQRVKHIHTWNSDVGLCWCWGGWFRHQKHQLLW